MRQNGIASSLWKGAKAGYHHYRATSLEARARAHRARAVLNPHRAGIPGRVVEVRYLRGGRDRGRYVHRFGPNVRIRLGPRRSQLMMYHARGEPIWADARGRDFDHWVDVDHKRRRDMNPRRRRARRRSRPRGPDWTTLALIGAGLYFFMARPAGAVSTGGQAILAQPTNTLWYSDPYQGGGGEFFQGGLPPGAAPPWRLASATEQTALQQGLLAGTMLQAGGGLFAPNPAFLT